jgi:uncharacterized protein
MGTQLANEVEFPLLHDSRYPIHGAADVLEPYLRAIVERIRPEKIILFGSYAYGKPNEHSDFDLLVIRKGIRNSTQSNIEIRHALSDVTAPRPSFTFLSCTPESFEAKVREGSFVYGEIASKGLLLYGV